MKNIILSAIFFINSMVLFSQSTANPDTVCYGTSGSVYQLVNTPGLTYNWVVSSPGILQSGQGTNQINVDWSAALPGIITNGITVVATDANGCTSNPVTLDVFIYQVIPTITPVGPFCEGYPCVNLVTSPIGGQFAGNGTIGNQFCPISSGNGTHIITYTVNVNGCIFTTTTSIVVNPTPVLSPIQHN